MQRDPRAGTRARTIASIAIVVGIVATASLVQATSGGPDVRALAPGLTGEAVVQPGGGQLVVVGASIPRRSRCYVGCGYIDRPPTDELQVVTASERDGRWTTAGETNLGAILADGVHATEPVCALSVSDSLVPDQPVVIAACPAGLYVLSVFGATSSPAIWLRTWCAPAGIEVSGRDLVLTSTVRGAPPAVYLYDSNPSTQDLEPAATGRGLACPTA